MIEGTIKEVVLDEPDRLSLRYSNGDSVEFYLFQDDYRMDEDMDTSVCHAEPEGCCFEHSGCGYEKCITHYPLQNARIDFDYPQKLIGKRVINFIADEGDERSSVHTFLFVLENGDCVDLDVCSNTSHYGITIMYELNYEGEMYEVRHSVN